MLNRYKDVYLSNLVPYYLIYASLKTISLIGLVYGVQENYVHYVFTW